MLICREGQIFVHFDEIVIELWELRKEFISILLGGKDFDPDFLLSDLQGEASGHEKCEEIENGRATALDVRDLLTNCGVQELEMYLEVFWAHLELAARHWKREALWREEDEKERLAQGAVCP